MSDSEHSTVTYTSVSFPVEDDSDIGSPGVDGPPIMPEDPYAYIMAAYEVPPSPDYIPGPEVPPSPDYIPGPEVPPSPDYIPGPEEPQSPPHGTLFPESELIPKQDPSPVLVKYPGRHSRCRDIIMSDSEHSTVTYTSVSFPVEDDSDIGSPGVDGPPIMPEDPYAYIMAAYEVPPSPDYIPGPEVPPSPDYIPGPEVPPSPDYIPGPEEPQSPPPLDFVPESDPEEEPEEDDEDPEEDPADYPADRDDDDDEDEDEDEEEEEEHPAPADFVPPVHRMTARISIRDEPSISLPPREEVERLLALTTPPPSPLTPLSSPLPQIPSPTPNSPTHIEIPESCLPLRKRVRFASPTPSREVGESSTAVAARQDRTIITRDDPYSIAREDLYGFFYMVDVPPRCSTSRELDYDITVTWDELVGAINEISSTTLERVNLRVTDLATIVEEETTSMYGIMEDAQEREAKMAREAWGLSMDSSDYARSDVMSLRTTVVAQSALISELQSADHRRQRVISELLTSDHKRQVQLTKTLRLLKGLQTQMVEF
ncbi:hypothetical protein Tco_1106996 [Tanacetum coccineum]